MRTIFALFSAAMLLALLGAAVGVLVLPAAKLSETDLQLHVPVERPFDVMIWCDVHKESGWAWYGGDAGIGAFFVGCKPQGDLYFDVRSTATEACESKTQPEVSFLLDEFGEVKSVGLTRSSGSSSVDHKLLEIVQGTRFPPTNCGLCAVVARVPVNLQCDDSHVR